MFCWHCFALIHRSRNFTSDWLCSLGPRRSCQCWPSRQPCGLRANAFVDQRGRCLLDTALEFGHDVTPVEPGLNWREKLHEDSTRTLEEGTAPPEQTGVERHQHERETKLHVKCCHTRLVGLACAYRCAGALRKDRDWPTIGG